GFPSRWSADCAGAGLGARQLIVAARPSASRNPARLEIAGAEACRAPPTRSRAGTRSRGCTGTAERLDSGPPDDVRDEGKRISDLERRGGEERLGVLGPDLPAPVARERFEVLPHRGELRRTRLVRIVKLAPMAIERGDPVVELVRDIDDEGRRRAWREEIEVDRLGLVGLARDRRLAQMREIVGVRHDVPGLVVVVVTEAAAHR